MCIRDRTTWVRDAWPVRRQTYGYLSSRRASPPVDRYQIIGLLLGDRGTCVNNLPKVVTWQCSGPESIREPFDHQSGPLPLDYQVTQIKYYVITTGYLKIMLSVSKFCYTLLFIWKQSRIQTECSRSHETDQHVAQRSRIWILTA